MALEYGLERYEELYKYFADTPGPVGPIGVASNAVMAIEARERTLNAATNYTGYIHTIQANVLGATDSIGCTFWYNPFSITAIGTIALQWVEPGGGVATATTLNLALTPRQYVFNFSQDPRDTSILTASIYGVASVGGASVQIIDAGGFVVYDWISIGGAARINIITGAGNPGAIVHTRAYYYHIFNR